MKTPEAADRAGTPAAPQQQQLHEPAAAGDQGAVPLRELLGNPKITFVLGKSSRSLYYI